MPDQPQADLDIHFEDPNVLNRLRSYIEKNVIVFDMLEESIAFARGYEAYVSANRHFEQQYPNLAAEYRRLVALTKWIAAVRISDQEFLDLCEHHFVAALRNPDIVVWDKIVAHLVTMPREDRDPFKQKIRSALLKNEEPLTAEFVLDADGKRQDPTVQNWLKDYNRTTGTGRISPLQQAEYLEKSENPRRLSEEERKLLKDLLFIYERSKISSLVPEGLENDLSVKIGEKKMILRNGQLEEVKLNQHEREIMEKAFEIARATNKWQADQVIEVLSREYARVQQWLQPLLEQTERYYGHYPRSLARDLIEWNAQGKGNDLAAGLVFLAKHDALFQILVRPGVWYDRTVSLLTAQYSDKVLKDFEKRLFAPPYLLVLLRDLLKGLDGHDQPIIGTMIATELENHNHAGYGQIAYAHPDWAMFVWGEPVKITDHVEIVDAIPPEQSRALTPRSQRGGGIPQDEVQKLLETHGRVPSEREERLKRILQEEGVEDVDLDE